MRENTLSNWRTETYRRRATSIILAVSSILEDKIFKALITITGNMLFIISDANVGLHRLPPSPRTSGYETTTQPQ